jgi:hypothetical protein
MLAKAGGEMTAVHGFLKEAATVSSSDAGQDVLNGLAKHLTGLEVGG